MADAFRMRTLCTGGEVCPCERAAQRSEGEGPANDFAKFSIETKMAKPESWSWDMGYMYMYMFLFG